MTDFNKQQFYELLQAPRYYCPVYQRRYVWEQSNVQLLFEDLLKLKDKSRYQCFLGPIVLEHSDTKGIHKEGKHIIDGQQRFTTLILIILAAINEISKQADKETAKSELANSQLLVVTPYLSGQIKFLPSIYDRIELNKVIDLLDLDINRYEVKPGEEESEKTDTAIQDRFEDIRKLLENELSIFEPKNSEGKIQWLQDFIQLITKKVIFAVIQLGPDLDPQEVFDRLNFAGKPLTIEELFRNYTLQKLQTDDPKILEKCYEDYWLNFEKGFSEKDKDLRKYLYPLAQTIKHDATKESALTILKEKTDSFFENNQQNEAEAIKTFANSITEFSKYKEIFLCLTKQTQRSIDDAMNDLSKETQYFQEFFSLLRDLQELKLEPATFAYVFQVIHRGLTKTDEWKEVEKTLRNLESFIVRRRIVRRERSGLSNVLKPLIEKSNNKTTPHWQDLQNSLLTVSTSAFPDDEEFTKYIKGESKDSEVGLKKNIQRYALWQYELSIQQLRVDPIKRINMPWEKKRLTVDHVRPQSPSKRNDWPGWNQKFEQKWLNKWANLVPMTSKENSTKRNLNFEESLAKFTDKDGVIKTQWDSALKIYTDNKDAGWGPDQVKARAEELSDWAVDRWKYNQ